LNSWIWQKKRENERGLGLEKTSSFVFALLTVSLWLATHSKTWSNDTTTADCETNNKEFGPKMRAGLAWL
ncbi:MAG: hypothetical protein WAX04_07390, partial [Oscillospiraceae bacterium]